MPSRCLAMLAVPVQGLACSAARAQTPPSAAELAGDGALHAAAVACLKALLGAGASPDLPDRQGPSPLALARFARAYADDCTPRSARRAVMLGKSQPQPG